MKTALYKGPEVHTRVLSRQDFIDAGVPESDLPEAFVELRWDAWGARKPVDVTAAPESVLEILERDPAMEIKEDGKVVSEAVDDAAHVNADGSSAGVAGSPVLAEAIGFPLSSGESAEDSGSEGEEKAEKPAAKRRSTGGSQSDGSAGEGGEGSGSPAATGGSTSAVGGSTASSPSV